MFELGPEVKRIAGLEKLESSYVSIHLRIEEDAMGNYMTGFGSHDEIFATIKGALVRLAVNSTEMVYVSVGLPVSSHAVQMFMAQVTPYRFVFGRPMEELEFKAAVEFEICSLSRVHLGFYKSSFDFMLHVKRRGKGLHTINLHANGENNPVLEAIFSPKMFP